MTDRERFVKTFSHLHASAHGTEEITAMLSVHERRQKARLTRRALTLALAAVLLLGLGVTAYAVADGFRQRQQEAVREQYRPEAKHVESYVEYELAEEPQEGVALLSAYSDGGLKLYFTVSPVEEEDVRDMPMKDTSADGEEHFMLYLVSADGHDGMLASFYTPGEWEYRPEEYETWIDENGNEITSITAEGRLRRYLAQSYDAESKTLTLCIGIPASQLPEEGREVTLHVASYDYWERPDESHFLPTDARHALHQDFGSITVTIPEPDIRRLDFPEPIVFTNPDYSGVGEILGADISATGITWRIRVDDPDAHFAVEGSSGLDDYLRQFSWDLRIDEVLKGSVLRLADGTEKDCWGFNAHYMGEDLIQEYPTGWWPDVIDLHEIRSLCVAGERIEIPQT